MKSRLIGKDSDAGKIEGRRERDPEDEMVGQHHRFNGREFEQTQEDGEVQGPLTSCSPWGHKQSGMTWPLTDNNNNYY